MLLSGADQNPIMHSGQHLCHILTAVQVNTNVQFLLLLQNYGKQHKGSILGAKR